MSGEEKSFADKIAESKKRRREEEEESKKAAASSLGAALASEGESSAAAWVARSKQNSKTKKSNNVESRLDEEESNLVKTYTAEDVAGLRVMHDAKDLGDGGEGIVLTLADRNVLDEEEDVLQSAQLVQQEKQRELERYKKNKGKPVYDVFDHDAPVLKQYDDEPRKASFVIGAAPNAHLLADAAASHQRLSDLKAKAALEAKRLVYDVSSSGAKIASDFMTREEMAAAEAAAGGKKKKKKGEKKEKKRRKKKTTSELLEELEQGGNEEEADGEQDRASAATAGERRKEKSEAGNMQNLLEKEARYKTALAKAMRLTKEKLFEKDEEEEEQKIVVKKVRKEKGIEQSSFCSEKKIQKESRVQRETMSVAEKLASRAKARKEAKVEEGLVFSSTAEFLRAVGNNADALDTKMFPVKKEKTEAEVEVKKEEEEGEVEEGEVEAEPVAGVLEDEPDVGQGLAATLQFLRKNGATGETPSVVARLQDGSVSKKHKTYLDDEEDVPVPEGVRLDLQKYDEFGRPVSRKEAFRQLSQGFHGNAPGAAKQEKRLRQLMSQRKVEQRASTAGTLKTLEKVEQRQKESGTAGIKLGIDSAELEDMQEQAALLVKQKLQAKLAKKKK